MAVAVKPKRKHFTITLEYETFRDAYSHRQDGHWGDTTSERKTFGFYSRDLCKEEITRLSRLLFGDTPRRVTGNKLKIKFVKSKVGELVVKPGSYLDHEKLRLSVYVPRWLTNRLYETFGADKDGNVRFYVEVETEWTKDR